MLNPLSKIGKWELLSFQVDWTSLYELMCLTFNFSDINILLPLKCFYPVLLGLYFEVIVDFNHYKYSLHTNPSSSIEDTLYITEPLWAPPFLLAPHLWAVEGVCSVLPEIGVVNPCRLASGQNKACWGERLTQNRICCSLSLMLARTRTSEHSRTQEEWNTDPLWNRESKFRLLGEFAIFVMCWTSEFTL